MYTTTISNTNPSKTSTADLFPSSSGRGPAPLYGVTPPESRKRSRSAYRAKDDEDYVDDSEPALKNWKTGEMVPKRMHLQLFLRTSQIYTVSPIMICFLFASLQTCLPHVPSTLPLTCIFFHHYSNGCILCTLEITQIMCIPSMYLYRTIPSLVQRRGQILQILAPPGGF